MTIGALTPRLRAVDRNWSPTAVMVGTSVFAGIAIGSGGRLPLVATGVCAMVALAAIIGANGLRSILVWLVLSPLLYPFLRYPAGHPLITFDRIWIPALLGCVLVGRRRLPFTPATRTVALAMVALVVAWGLRAATTPPAVTSLKTWVDGAFLPALLFVVVRWLVRTPREVERVAGAMAVGGTVLAFTGIGQKLIGYDLASKAGGVVRYDHEVFAVRISGAYPVPEVFALVLVISLAATLYWALLHMPSRMWLGGLAAVVQTVAIALTLFRAAWISAAFVLAFSLGVRPGRRMRTLIGIVVAGVSGLLILSVAQGNQIVQERLHNTQNIDGRVATYVQALGIFRQHPFAGVGVGNFINAQTGYGPVWWHGVESVPSPHSSFVGTLVEQGLLGFVPFVALLVAVALLVRRFRRDARSSADRLLAVCVTGACIGYVVMSLGLTMLPYGSSNAVLAVLLGLVACRYDVVANTDELYVEAP